MRWSLIAGAVAGLALIFELDPGVYLGISFAFYWSLTELPFVPKRTPHVRSRWVSFCGFAVALIVTWTIGAMIGSRGTLLHPAFWKGYVEGLNLQAFSGLGLLPIAMNDDGSILFFVLILLVYLIAVGRGIALRDLPPDDGSIPSPATKAGFPLP